MLTHNRHSGKIIPHHHTAYLPLLLIVLAGGFLLLGFTSSALSDPPPVSGAYSVTGVVPTSVPVLAAHITSPASNQIVHNSQIVVSGLCQAGNLIKVYRNGVMAGSDFCSQAGSFKFPINLSLGANTLIARSYNILGDPGPDSPAVIITYQLAGATGGSGATQVVSSFQILGDSSYQAFELNQETSWQLELQGGAKPFAVSIEWGDGQSDLLSRPDDGRFIVKHTYRNAPINGRSFTININATDTTGAKAYLHLPALMAVAAAKPAVTNGAVRVAWPIWIIILLIVLSFGFGAWVEGEHRKQDEQRRRNALLGYQGFGPSL